MREPIRRGQDVRSLRKVINQAFAGVPKQIRTEGAASSTNGDTTSFSVVGEDIFYIKLNAKTGTNPVRYSWTAVVRNRDTNTWCNSPREGDLDCNFAVELNNASLPVGNGKRFAARVNPQDGRVTFDQGGGGGSVDITASDVRFLALGTYDEYKDCPGVPPKPPTIKTSCGEDTGVLCVPAYAGAFYVRCGYVWLKIADTRTLGVWTTGLNGGTLPAMRRLYMTTFGGDRDPATGLPDPESDCMGVAALEYSSQGSLTCNCPTCLSSPPPGKCLAVQFRTPERPEDPAECADAVAVMDAADAWDKTFLLPFDVLGCTAGAAIDGRLFTFEWQFVDGSTLSCDWGPDVFDPCDPCEHWGRLYSSITINAGNEANCGGLGVWRGEFKTREICDLICDCENGPIGAVDESLCDGCGNVTPPAFQFIIAGSVEISCCPSAAIDGGSPAALPADIVDGGSPTSLPADIIDGGTV